MKRILLVALTLGLAFTGCKNKLDDTSVGSLTLNVTQSTDGFNVVTRANDNLDDFVIEIFRPSDNWSVDYIFSEIKGDMVTLGSGDYTITAHSPEKADAAWNLPHYSATQNFTIKAGEVTPISLVCELTNVKVTVVLSDGFKQELSTYNVVVSNGKGSLTWVKDENVNDFEAGKEGYFSVAPLEVVVNGHRAIDNTSASTTLAIDNVIARNHHIINIDAKVTGQLGGDSDGDGVPDSGIVITVDPTVNQKDENVFVDGLEEIPVTGGEDGEEEGDGEEDVTPPVVETRNPKLVWVGNDAFEERYIEEGMTVDLSITAPNGIETFKIDVDSEILSVAIPYLTGDGSMTLDLIGDQVLIDNFANTDGLNTIPTGDKIYGKGKDEPVVISIGNLITLINGLGPASGSKHKFTVRITDAEGLENAEPKTLVFVSK